MAIKVRVLQKPDDSFTVERETADGSGSFTLLKAFTEDQLDRACNYADRQFAKLNRPVGAPADLTVYLRG